MAVATLSDRPVHKSWLESLLGLAAEVHPGEAVTVLLLASNGFLILCAYYVIRPIRSALLLPVRFTLPGGGLITGPEILSYSGAILAGLFLFIVPLYGSFASRVNRIRLINYMTLFFASNLVIFFLLGSAGDMLNALATLVIVQILGLGVRAFALVNLALVVVWLVIAFGLFRENRRLTADAEAAAA